MPMTSNPVVVCHLCDKPVRTDRDLHEVTGWVRYRTQGGTNAVTHETQTGLWAHKACLEEKDGRQEELAL